MQLVVTDHWCFNEARKWLLGGCACGYCDRPTLSFVGEGGETRIQSQHQSMYSTVPSFCPALLSFCPSVLLCASTTAIIATHRHHHSSPRGNSNYSRRKTTLAICAITLLQTCFPL